MQEDHSSEDPHEPIIALKRGVHATPWHPGRIVGSPHMYKVCVIGANGTGKSSICNRLVSRTFDANYRPTRETSQLFWRLFDESLGNDVMVEIEDTPGLEVSHGGRLTEEQRTNMRDLLAPLVWFERRRSDVEPKKPDPRAHENDPLLPDGTPRVSKAVTKKTLAEKTKLPFLHKRASGGVGRGHGTGGDGGGLSNPIGNFEAQYRKRMGFVIVADVSSNASFEVAYDLVESIFDRLQAALPAPPWSLPRAPKFYSRHSNYH